MLIKIYFYETAKINLHLGDWSDYSNSKYLSWMEEKVDNLSQLFVEAGTLMLAGMVFVFVFLGLLVVFINGVLKKLAIRFPDPIVQAKPVRSLKPKIQTDDGISPSIVAAISASIAKYRQQQINNK